MINDVKGLKLISLLTGDSEKRRFIIPEYQRDYKWGKEEISQFVTDIFEAYDDFENKKDYSYFLGAVITEKQQQSSEEGFSEYHLIDGQQRITTSILFIKLLYSLYKNEIDPKDILTNSKMRNTLTQFDTILWCDGIPENRKCKLISKKNGESSDLENVLIESEFVNKTSRFFINYELLDAEYDNHIKERDEFNLSNFIQFVFNNLEFVQVDTNSREAAMKIFSVLNTRGLELNSTDIIKAEVMAFLPQNKHADFSAKWKKLEEKASDLDLPLESIFRYYITMYRPSSIKGTNDTNIKEIWNEERFRSDKFLALQDFEKFTLCLEYIWDMNDPYIWCLRHLLILGKNAYTWIPVLVTMKYNDYSDQDIYKIAKFITKWHWIHLVYGWTVEKIKSFNFSLIKDIKERKEIDDILELKPRIITHDEESEEWLLNNFVSTLKDLDIYHTRWGRPLLFFLHNLELLEHDKQEQSFIFKSLTRDDTIEHVRPQNSSDDGDDKKHVIGNLTILNRRKNSSVGTDFDKKAKEYDKVLYAFTPSLSEKNPWSNERIDKRSDELISKLCGAINI